MLARIQALIDEWSKRLAWLPPTVARLALFFTFFFAGWGKLGALEATVNNFRDVFEMPVPEITAPLVAVTEVVCGVLLLVGLFTRFAAIPLAITMLVALFTYFWGETPNKLDLFGKAEAGYIIMCLWLVVYGAGALSLDSWLARKLDLSTRTKETVS
jgi:putative oxidoreductase